MRQLSTKSFTGVWNFGGKLRPVVEIFTRKFREILAHAICNIDALIVVQLFGNIGQFFFFL